ncbi:hypothetical protein CLOM_g828 [Closterium sp. NIES-68]|nr:hypothetical protein CLOM_g828 [Closterium sp. NIES-68]GJP71286.1 hypothetical protein CLOP_g2135 [Closterium sp. NIES-67]
MGGKWGAISKLHAFPKAEDHLTQKTLSGAIVTLLGVAIMVVLFAHELSFVLTPEVHEEMAVDKTPRGEKLDVYLNISFPALPCNVISLDALDMSGNHEVDISANMYKIRLDRRGMVADSRWLKDPTGAWRQHKGKKRKGHSHGKNPTPHHGHGHAHGYGQAHVAAGQKGKGGQEGQEKDEEDEDDEGEEVVGLEQTVLDVQKAMAAGEGCQLYGHLAVERVAGNFHVSVHGQSYMVLQQVFSTVGDVNVSHIIHSLGFGVPYPGRVNPLDGFVRILPPLKEGEDPARSSGTFKYFLKVVPTRFHFWHGGSVKTNQYSISEYFTPSSPQSNALPAVYFLYDLSPIAVSITESHRSFFHFLTRLCAVLGGTFALTGMLDRWVYSLLQLVNRPRHPYVKTAHRH